MSITIKSKIKYTLVSISLIVSLLTIILFGVKLQKSQAGSLSINLWKFIRLIDNNNNNRNGNTVEWNTIIASTAFAVSNSSTASPNSILKADNNYSQSESKISGIRTKIN